MSPNHRTETMEYSMVNQPTTNVLWRDSQCSTFYVNVRSYLVVYETSSLLLKLTMQMVKFKKVAGLLM